MTLQEAKDMLEDLKKEKIFTYNGVKDIIEADRKEIINHFREVLNKHRAEGIITCVEDCFCWDVETKINELESAEIGTMENIK